MELRNRTKQVGVDEVIKPSVEFVVGPSPQQQKVPEPPQETVATGENLLEQEQQIVKMAKKLSEQLKSQLKTLGLDANHLFVDRLNNDLLTQFSGLAKVFRLVKELSAQKDAVGSNRLPSDVRRFFHDTTGLVALQELVAELTTQQETQQRLETAAGIAQSSSQVMFARIHNAFVQSGAKIEELRQKKLLLSSDLGLTENDLKMTLTELTAAVYGANIDQEDLPQDILLAELVDQLNQWVALHNQSEAENNRGTQLLIKLETNLSQIDHRSVTTALTTAKAVTFLSNLISNARKAYKRRQINQSEHNLVTIKIEGIIGDDAPMLVLRVDDFAGGFDSGSAGEHIPLDGQEFQPVELSQVNGGWRAQDQSAASPPRLVAQSRNVGLKAQMEFVQKLGGDYQVGTRFDRATRRPVGATVLLELPLHQN